LSGRAAISPFARFKHDGLLRMGISPGIPQDPVNASTTRSATFFEYEFVGIRLGFHGEELLRNVKVLISHGGRVRRGVQGQTSVHIPPHAIHIICMTLGWCMIRTRSGSTRCHFSRENNGISHDQIEEDDHIGCDDQSRGDIEQVAVR
jgi:hypothetical protein